MNLTEVKALLEDLDGYGLTVTDDDDLDVRLKELGFEEDCSPERDALLNSMARDNDDDFPHETDPQENA